MQRMSPLDASFLHLENDVNHMHIGSVGIFEGPPPDYGELCRMVESKLPLVPRYRQRVRFVPLTMGRPVWTDDPHFSIRYHVRHSALPAPGDEERLLTTVSRVMGQQLDRHRPLWEMWAIEGLSGGRWALLTKVHHSMVDGVAGAELLRVILDTERQPEAVRPIPWRAEPEPSDAYLLAESLAERAISPYEGLRTALALTRTPRRFAMYGAGALKGLLSYSRAALPPTPRWSINGPVGPHRRWALARGHLSDVKTIREAFGGTVNDVVLAAIAGGFRDLLLSRGERVEGRELRTFVPVSVRAPDERGTYNNRVSGIFATLPIDLEDPVARLESIHAQTQRLKRSGQAVAGDVLTSLSGFAPAMLLALGMRVAARVPQRNFNTVTTNVPGPRCELYAAGRRLIEAFPYVPIGSTLRVGVAIFSYNGTLGFGVTSDWDTVPDVEVLTKGIERGLSELLSTAEKRRRPQRQRRANGRGRSAGSARGASSRR